VSVKTVFLLIICVLNAKPTNDTQYGVCQTAPNVNCYCLSRQAFETSCQQRAFDLYYVG